MAKKGSTGSRKPPTESAERPLVETNGDLAITILQGWLAKFEQLDPRNRDAALEAQSYLLEDVRRVFGLKSPEASQVWENGIVDERRLPWSEEDVDPYGDGLLSRSNAEKMKSQFDKMRDRIGRLVDRAKELAARSGAMCVAQGEDKVNPFSVFEEQFQLIKPSGERHHGRGIWGDHMLTVHIATFPVAVGDTVERRLPNGIVERREVANIRFQKGVRDAMPDAYHLDLRSASARTAAPPQRPAVVHHHNYNISGSTIGAVGENATVASSHVIGHATQWNGSDPKAIAAELKTLRKALAAAADGDGADAAQAEADLEHVNAANKAIAVNDEGAFKGAMKKLSAFGWKLFEKVTTAATMAYLQAHGVLPPAAHHEALAPGGK